MTSNKQIQANRNNVQKSTGPISEQGKKLASGNALKHGLLAQSLIIRDEDPRSLELLMSDLARALQPHGEMEEILVEKIGVTLWRLRRLIEAETSALQEKDWMGKLEKMHQAYNTRAVESMTRYESSLERAFYRALHELQRLQGMRQGKAAFAPIAVDIHSNV